MQDVYSDELNEVYFDEEDAEGEPYDSYSSNESYEGSDDEPSDADVPKASHKGKGKARALEDAKEAELEVDQDFVRLVHDIRSGDAASGTLSKVWDFDVRDREQEFKDDLREASGVGKKRGRKPGRRKGVILSQQVRALIGEGNQAYVDNNLPETIRIMQEVIRIEPRASSAWSVLAQCHEDLGELQKALQLRIMAAHLNQDPEEWYRLADQSKQLGYHQQALYCYRKLYQVDPSNVTALWDRASLAREIGDLRTARQAFLAILKHVPHDLNVLAELRPILIELSDLDVCATLFQEAFEHYQTVFPSGEVSIPAQDHQGNVVGFGLMEVLVLADLYNTLGKYDLAVRVIRQGCRWMQGRAVQKFWDSIEDDREWDVPIGPNGESARVVGEGEVQPGMYSLDVNARHRLAIARIKMGDTVEGKMHASIVLGQDITEYAPLFSEIADAYFEREMYAEAGNIYEMLGADAGTSSLYVLLQAAACRRMLGDLKEAAEVYEHVIKADPTHNDAKMKLAEIYEILNEPRKALDLVLQVIDSRRRPRAGAQDQGSEGQPGALAPGASLFEEKPRAGKDKAVRIATQKAAKLNAAQLKELEAQKERDAVLSYGRVKELWTRMLAGDVEANNEWMHEAESLIESFRETRALFLTTRHVGFRGVFPRSRRRTQSDEANEDSMASRLQLELGRDSLAWKAKSDGTSSQTLDSFRKISFDDWLRLFMQYAFNLTKKGQYDDAQDLLRHISYSNALQKRRYQDTIRCALITCSLTAGRPDIVVEQTRKLINTHQFNNEPFRILLASLSSGLHNTDAFLASTLTKHLLREVRAIDAALKNPESLKWNPVLKRYGTGGKVEDDEDDAGAEPAPGAQDTSEPKPRLPSKQNPIGVALYGQVCLAAKSYQSALFYLLHAYDYCSHDPIICLCLAIASIGRAMQRQADNRHHLITQGLAFLSRYRTLRGQDASNLDEIEFNFGRAFHQLGLFSLASKHYTRVLDIIEERQKVDSQDMGVAREAAYNLSTIYVMTGATPLAQALYRKWLSL